MKNIHPTKNTKIDKLAIKMQNISPKTILATLTTIILCAMLLQGCTSIIAPLAGNIISRTTGLHHSSTNEPDHAGLARKEPAQKQYSKSELEQTPKQKLKQESNLEQEKQ